MDGPTNSLQRATGPPSLAPSGLLALTPLQTACSVCQPTDPSHLQGAALDLDPGPPGPKPLHAQLHLRLGDLELHAVPLQPGDQAGLSALQRSRQGPQQGCSGRWGLAHPAVGGRDRAHWGLASSPWLFPVPHLCSKPLAWASRPHCSYAQGGVRGWKHILSALRAQIPQRRVQPWGFRLRPLTPHDP